MTATTRTSSITSVTTHDIDGAFVESHGPRSSTSSIQRAGTLWPASRWLTRKIPRAPLLQPSERVRIAQEEISSNHETRHHLAS